MNALRRFAPISLALLLGAALLALPARADNNWFSSTHHASAPDYPKGPVSRDYNKDDRVRYQLWPYTWNPNPDEPITHITINIAQQMVYVYQGDHLAAKSPVTTGKPGHETPTGHFAIIKKDINHKSNLYGFTVDEHGNVVDDNANAGEKQLAAGVVYDAADMPYYMRLREDGTGMHGGYLPGYPASHGCIRLPHAFAELLYSNVSIGVPVDIVEN
jgi:lipoprotein-anchoring transpeptidase ErfK/SrfK